MRLIDADAIIEKKWKAESEACFYALEDVVSVTDIEEAPTIEVSEEQLSKLQSSENSVENTTVSEDFTSFSRAFHEQKEGEWIRVSADKYVQHAYHHYRCSACGEDTIGEPNYCSNCGAKMRLE